MEDEFDELNKLLTEIQPITKKITKLLFKETNGHGGKTILALGACLGYLETQQKGSIEGITLTAKMLALNYKRNTEMQKTPSGSDTIN